MSFLVSLVAQVTQTSANSQPFWSGSVLAAFAAAAAALIGAIVTVVFQSKMSQRQQEHEGQLADIARAFTTNQREVDYRMRQLSELYGPLTLLRATENGLRKSLPSKEVGDEGERWRLVRHIEDARRTPAMKVIVEAILAINEGIETLLITKAGLMEGDSLPESFKDFMHHSKLLKLAWEHEELLRTEGTGVVRIDDIPFNENIDQDIAKATSSIRSALDRAKGA
jgi:hypothetical protein